MDIQFNKKTVFLTGASRGIGRQIKELFEADGAKVTAPARDELDLSSPDNISRYLQERPDIRADIFIHCAGINQLAGIESVSQEILESVFQVNFFSAVQLAGHFSGAMKQNGWGRMVFISSLYSLVSKERRIAYSSSKNALTGLTKTLALELGQYHILVNAVAPGYVMTDMTRRNLSDEQIKELESQIPTGRLQTADDIAALTAFLCSEFNQSINGQLIAVDGGLTCR